MGRDRSLPIDTPTSPPLHTLPQQRHVLTTPVRAVGLFESDFRDSPPNKELLRPAVVGNGNGRKMLPPAWGSVKVDFEEVGDSGATFAATFSPLAIRSLVGRAARPSDRGRNNFKEHLEFITGSATVVKKTYTKVGAVRAPIRPYVCPSVEPSWRYSLDTPYPTHHTSIPTSLSLVPRSRATPHAVDPYICLRATPHVVYPYLCLLTSALPHPTHRTSIPA